MGYAAPRAGVEAPAAAELTSFLKERLPQYMVPATMTILATLPRTAGGKLDVAALPPPSREVAGAAGVFAAPSTPEEMRLAVLWSELLGREPIGAQDDFFELGGHSLHAVEALARIRRAFGVDLAVRALYETPRLADLARTLARARRAARPERP